MRAPWSLLVAAVLLTAAVAQNPVPGVPMTQEQVQEMLRIRNLPDCTNQDLKTTLHVFETPDQMQVIALDYVNLTKTACALRPDGGPKQGPDLELLPGQTASSNFRWRTEPITAGGECHDLTFRTITVNRKPHGILLASSTLLPHICSNVEYRKYSPGPFVPDWDQVQTAKTETPAAPVLTSTKPSYFVSEQIDMRLRVQGARKQGECPTFIQTIRDAKGFIRMDEITGPKQGCRMTQLREPQASEYQIDSGQASRWSGPGDRTFTVAELLGYGPDGEARLLTSNPLSLHIADSSEMQRTWGAVDKGLRADLTVDKTVYGLGDDVPLHIAVENVSADQPVYGEPYHMRPAFGDYSWVSIHAVVEDADGPLPLTAGPYGQLTFGGPGACPGKFTQGAVVPYEKSLREMGLLPAAPGTYTVTVVWTPFTTQARSCEDAASFNEKSAQDRPYASIKSNKVVLQIGDTSAAKHEYNAWKDRFELTDTSFGDRTALLDRSTKLEWLRLNFSAHLSYKQVTSQMTPGGRFEGWRYATAAELQAFFRNFIGQADSTTDPVVEAKLQRLMGGPLQTVANPETGWRRTASLGLVSDVTKEGRERRGYIAYDEPGGATVTADVWGYTTDDYPVEGSYLVRQK